MTVQELFKSLDKEDFIKYYCQYEDVLAGKYEVTEKGKKIVTDLFNQLLTIEPLPAKENKNWIIFSIPEAGTISLSSFTAVHTVKALVLKSSREPNKIVVYKVGFSTSDTSEYVAKL